MSNIQALVHAPSLMVHQKKEMLEVFSGFETQNRYEVRDPNGQLAMYAGEEGGGGMDFITRSFLKAKRPFTMRLTDAYGAPAYVLRRPWNWFLSELHVQDAAGQPIGMIDEQWAFFARRFIITGANGEQLAELHGPWFKPWTFRILQNGQEVGAIKKQWSGFLKEAFTDADNFGLELGPQMNPQLRALALAATFLIDFLFLRKQGIVRINRVVGDGPTLSHLCGRKKARLYREARAGLCWWKRAHLLTGRLRSRGRGPRGHRRRPPSPPSDARPPLPRW